MRWEPLLVIMLGLNAGAEDLLKNPSFEIVSNGAPADWSVFVQPKQDATSFLDQRVAKDGSNSVKLSIGSPYIEDPANNWSQNILADLRGKRLRLKGYIKTDNAAEAAIWVQCYAKDPLKLTSQESTSSKGLLTGTNDWTAVEATIDVPSATDFVVLRCVLRFRGTAWFDALSLEALAPNPAGPIVPALKMPVLPSMPALPDLKPAPTDKQFNPRDVLQVQEEMRKANWQLRQSNTEMSKQIEELRKQIEELKRQVGDTAAAAKLLQDEQSKPVEREKPAEVPPPPLVSGENTP
jgi:hypothetical protein